MNQLLRKTPYCHIYNLDNFQVTLSDWYGKNGSTPSSTNKSLFAEGFTLIDNGNQGGSIATFWIYVSNSPVTNQTLARSISVPYAKKVTLRVGQSYRFSAYELAAMTGQLVVQVINANMLGGQASIDAGPTVTFEDVVEYQPWIPS